MKSLIMIMALLFSFAACESSEAKVYKGTLFMSFVDNFEEGKSEEVFELKLDGGMKTLIFAGKPPKRFAQLVGKEISIEGSETDEGDILFLNLVDE